MREQFAHIMDNYLKAKTHSGSHPMRQYITRETASQVGAYVNSTSYKVQGSAGVGNWNDIPWVCVFDKEITESARHGIYVCYLFRGDMSGVYLTLNQGWTFYEENFKPRRAAKREIKKVANQWRQVLNPPTDITFDEIDLHHNGALAQGYELGHICGKYYSRDNLPSDDILVDDLRRMMEVYRELRNQMADFRDLAETTSELEAVTKTVEDVEDSRFQARTNSAQPEHTDPRPYPKPNPRVRGTRKSWPRKPGIAKGALERAGYQCEVDHQHTTFVSNATGQPYVEAHHLVPFSLQDDFENSLDVTQNVVSLCPTCHRRFHHAAFGDKQEVIEHFFAHRRQQLTACGINITLSQLLDAYR